VKPSHRSFFFCEKHANLASHHVFSTIMDDWVPLMVHNWGGTMLNCRIDGKVEHALTYRCDHRANSNCSWRSCTREPRLMNAGFRRMSTPTSLSGNVNRGLQSEKLAILKLPRQGPTKKGAVADALSKIAIYSKRATVTSACACEDRRPCPADPNQAGSSWPAQESTDRRHLRRRRTYCPNRSSCRRHEPGCRRCRSRLS